MIKVQIVEDDFEQATIMAKILTKDNRIEVINITEDGKKAIEMYLKLKPDILILDLNIPGMDGTEVLNFLCNVSSEERNKCNVIVLSGNFPNYRFKYTSKVFSCIDKPCNYNSLHSRIIEAYNNFSKQRNNKQICKNIFSNLGFNPNDLGPIVVTESVLLILESHTDMYDLKHLRSAVSKKLNMPEKNIQWNLDRVSRSLSEQCPISTFKQVFPNYLSTKSPSPKRLISLIVNTLEANDALNFEHFQ